MSKRLLFFVTEDWYFVSHRLGLGMAALAAGYEVHVATRVQAHGDQLKAAGLKVHALSFQRDHRRPWSDFCSLIKAFLLIRQIRPDVVHNVALKPVVLGGLAASLARVPRTINALAGLGFLFTDRERSESVLSKFVTRVLGFVCRSPGSTCLLQNEEDRKLVIARCNLSAENTAVIPGSGIEERWFETLASPAEEPCRVVLCARMLVDKGVNEFVEAARLLRERGLKARFVLVGAPDPANPSSLSVETLEAWRKAGFVEWTGRIDEPLDILADAQIACLPSYREGFPRALLEAAALGLPLLATDVPGCRELVVDNENGFLVPPADSTALANALQRLIEDPPLRERMGECSRSKARGFSMPIISSQTLDLYTHMPSHTGN